MGGHTTGVSAPTAETVAEALRPLTAAPERAGIFLDVDGTLAPIVARAEDAHVPERTAAILERLAARYAVVAGVSGRGAEDARELVGLDGIWYAGSHGAELLAPGARRPEVLPAFEAWTGRVREFAGRHRDAEARLEDKGPIVAYHWRGASDEEAARERLEAIARAAEAEGLIAHWGRKVLEIRPGVPVDKGQAVDELVRRAGARTALYAGDDATDLDGFDAVERTGGVKVGVASEEGPDEIVERADLVVDGTDGVLRVLESL
jgi:trehalose 6-phosphate phosphatase